MIQRLLFGLTVALLAAVSLAAQQQTPPAPAPQAPPVTFRVEVNYVEVDAIVTDAQGRTVSNLTADDFELFEDRRPQKVSAFSLVNIPQESVMRPLYSPTAIEPDVQTNTAGEGRLYLFVIDTLHTSPFNALKVRAAARQFVERYFAANDLAAVVFTGGQAKDTQDFTSSKRLLLAAIDKASGTKFSTPVQPGPMARADEFEREMHARNSMDRIRALAEFMANVRGRRKAMLLFGEGLEYDFSDMFTNTTASGVLENIRDAIGAAARANVAIYAIDPRGLENVGADAAQGAVPSAPGNPGDAASGDTPAAASSLTTVDMLNASARSLRVSQDSLRMISDETGGFAVVNQNGFVNAFERIVEDNSTYYVLGYYPTNDRRDGRFRSISVRLKRPGLTVRARRGYVAPRGRVPAPPAVTTTDPILASADRAIASPIPIPGIPLQITAAPFRGEGSNASVAIAVELGMQDIQLTESGGTLNGNLQMAYMATDAEGKERGNASHALTLNMRPETAQRGRERGFRVLSQIDLPPGRHQVRVGVGEAGGRSGSVIAHIDVPDFTAAPITMSGIALTSALAAETPTVKPRDPLAQFLPGPQTTMRTFTRNDQIALFVELYENLRNAPPHKIDLSTVVRSDTGQVVFQDRQERESAELQGGVGGYGYTTSFALADFAPGIYVIHVEGRSRATGVEAGVGRDVQITVR